MKFVVISDTHGQHEKLVLPQGDAIIHAGDLTKRGYRSEVIDFLKWYTELDFKYKIFIAGNHDFLFEQNPEVIEDLLPQNLIYLFDQSVTIEGIKIHGSPIQPWFHDWAFNRQRGEDIQRHWNLIPPDTDILITHGPPAGMLDRLAMGIDVGCENLKTTVEKIKPKFHIFGHIHESYGIRILEGVTYINACILNEDYIIQNEPLTFDFEGV
ncbi:MAG: metallophosphatase domain-containing protein [Bacteroidetes bacterium]|nr:metallophosphatase domain-containing protein [Bacteroidota bacterium]